MNTGNKEKIHPLPKRRYKEESGIRMALDFSTAALEYIRHWNNDFENTEIFNLEFYTLTTNQP